jgi:cell division septation protein DedD
MSNASPPQATPQPAAQAAVAPKPVTPSAATPPPRTETPPPRATTVPAAATSGAFAVQLGTFKDRVNADRLVRDVTAKGFNAFVTPIASGGHELYRVRVGPTRDRAAAEALAAQLRRIGQTDSSIVPIS